MSFSNGLGEMGLGELGLGEMGGHRLGWTPVMVQLVIISNVYRMFAERNTHHILALNRRKNVIQTT